jgi:hypothetical protein
MLVQLIGNGDNGDAQTILGAEQLGIKSVDELNPSTNLDRPSLPHSSYRRHVVSVACSADRGKESWGQSMGPGAGRQRCFPAAASIHSPCPAGNLWGD